MLSPSLLIILAKINLFKIRLLLCLRAIGPRVNRNSSLKELYDRAV